MRTHDVLVVGAGISGISVGVQLRESGVDDIAFIDAAGGFGGVWYWNRYPGAMCDVESLIYLPYLEETGYVPRERYAHADEIQQYLDRVVARYSLAQNALFHTTLRQLVWDEGAGNWVASTDRGDAVRSQFVVLASGHLERPQLPAIPGLEEFAGRAFHTSRWDYAYTGGDVRGGMRALRDKTVGVIGTGATGIQCIPHLGADAQRLFIFQRTPSTVAPRDNGPVDSARVRGLAPGWQEERRVNFSRQLEGHPVERDLVDDGWTRIFARVVTSGKMTSAPDEAVDRAVMDELRARIDSEVVAPATAEALKPYYSYTCKRPGFHDQYLATFNRENVTLVDTAGSGVDSIYPGGVVAAGRRYPLDCLVFATGFESTASAPKFSYRVHGSDGMELSQRWSNGVRSMFGIFVAGFPNLFVAPAPFSGQGAVSYNYTHLALHLAETVATVISNVCEAGASRFTVSSDAEAAWVREIVRRDVRDREHLASCTPGRANNDGALSLVPRENASFGPGSIAYIERLRAWRSTRSLPGLVLDAAEGR